jgi:glutamate N-acetyltransferase/amino-acid N-acetyltransferase
LDCDSNNIIPLSTGIIGWTLPKQNMIDNVSSITIGSVTVHQFAKAIMTTDAYPKAHKTILSNGSSILIVAKGAGMIEPNMATTLIIIMTDAVLEQDFMDNVLKTIVQKTFNCISIDGDQSTSDSCLLISSGTNGEVSNQEFEEKLLIACSYMADQIVRNGEGVKHVINVNITNASDLTIAKIMGKNIINSNLVKSAINANDPNVGRVMGAMLRNIVVNDINKIVVSLGDVIIFENGSIVQLDENIETKLYNYFKSCGLYETHKLNYPVNDKAIEININMNDGTEHLTIIGGDLTNEYVNVNGSYRS